MHATAARNFAKPSLTNDVREMNEFLRLNDRVQTIRELGNPSVAQTFLAIFLDWAWVFAATSLVYFYSPWWLPVAILIIGSRQRALVVLTHDASHFLLASDRRVNDMIANCFLCFPMLKSLKHYRAVHLPHHMNLGDEEHDTDFLHDPAAMKKGWLHVYLKYLLSYDLWVIAELRQTFSKISKRHMLCLAIWWGFVLAGLALVAGPSYALSFLGLWLVSRVFIYHAITTFIIISDHHGLFPGTILEYTRNHPSRGMLRWFIHPHNNGFHLSHHLAPFVPFYNLNKARKLLEGWARYDSAEQCETYFLGEKSVVRSWGKCIGSAVDAASNKFTPHTVQPAFNALAAVVNEASTTPEGDLKPTILSNKRVA